MRVHLLAKLLDAHVRAEEYCAKRRIMAAQKKKLQRTDPTNAVSSTCPCGHKIALRDM